MKTILIILAVYVLLDIVSSVWVYTALRINGWTMRELAMQFRKLLNNSAEDYLAEVAEEVNSLEREWEDNED